MYALLILPISVQHLEVASPSIRHVDNAQYRDDLNRILLFLLFILTTSPNLFLCVKLLVKPPASSPLSCVTVATPLSVLSNL